MLSLWLGASAVHTHSGPLGACDLTGQPKVVDIVGSKFQNHALFADQHPDSTGKDMGSTLRTSFGSRDTTTGLFSFLLVVEV